MTAGAICFTGVIGFVGLVSPHITRMVIGSDHRFLLPSSMLIGAILVLSRGYRWKDLMGAPGNTHRDCHILYRRALFLVLINEKATGLLVMEVPKMPKV